MYPTRRDRARGAGQGRPGPAGAGRWAGRLLAERASRTCASPLGGYSRNRAPLIPEWGYVLPTQPCGISGQSQRAPPPPEADLSRGPAGAWQGPAVGGRARGESRVQAWAGQNPSRLLETVSVEPTFRVTSDPTGSHTEAPWACVPQYSGLRLWVHTNRARMTVPPAGASMPAQQPHQWGARVEWAEGEFSPAGRCLGRPCKALQLRGLQQSC